MITPQLAVPRVRQAERPGFLIAVVMFTMMAVILPIMAVDLGSVTGDSTNIALAYAILVYSAFMIARICYAGAGAIVRLSFFIFCYVFMGIAVFAQVATLQFPLHLVGTGGYGAREITSSLISVIVGMVAFEASSLITTAVRARSADNTDDAPRPPREFSETRVLIVAAIALVFAALLIYRVGFRPFFDSRQATGNAVFGNAANAKTYATTNKATQGLLRSLGQVPALIALFAILYLKHHKLWNAGSRGRQLTTSTLLTLLVFVNLIVNNPIANSRFWFGTVSIAIASIYVSLNKNKGIRWAAIIAIFALLFAFTSLDAFRRTGGAQDHRTGFRNDLVTSGTYSAFTMEIIGRRWLTTNSHTEGRQFLGGALIFVPRSVWPSKPVDTGNLVLPQSNPAASLWTEGEVEAGKLGICLYFLLLGAASSVFDRRFRLAKPGTLVHAAVPIYAGLMIFLLRGSLLAVFGPAYLLTAILLFSVRRRPAQPSAEAPVLEAPTVASAAAATAAALRRKPALTRYAH